MEKIKLGENIYNLKKINSNLQIKDEIIKNKIIKLEFDNSIKDTEINNNKLNKPTIVFASMCKNEEHVIQETLESVVKYIDYWIICDTGSTDKTCKIILDFFKKQNIPGELYYDDWKGFDINKTLLFERCYKKADYILHLDADDILYGDFEFNNKDSGKLQYYVNCKRGFNSTNIYKVLILFNANYRWKFCGVAHTIIKCLDYNYETISNIEEIDGDLTNKNFYLISRDSGSRSLDVNKYYNDALKLREQFFNTLIDDPDNLNTRSIFYIAQSYRDANKIEQAIQYYSLYTKLNHIWNEELFESYMNLSRLHIKYNKFTNKIIEYYKNAINLFTDRAEPYYELGLYFNKINNYSEAYNLFIKAKEKDLQSVKQKYRLFVNEKCYNKYIYDELSIACYYLEKYDEGIFYLYEILKDEEFISHKERLLDNLQFFELKIKENYLNILI